MQENVCVCVQRIKCKFCQLVRSLLKLKFKLKLGAIIKLIVNYSGLTTVVRSLLCFAYGQHVDPLVSYEARCRLQE